MSDRVALYRLFDDAGDLLYVGISDDVGRRWSQHLKQKPWWPQVGRQTVDWYPGRDAAEAAEVAAIRTELPIHNVRHSTPSRGHVTHGDLPDGVVGVTVMELRRNWTEVLGRVMHADHRVAVIKNGKKAAYLVSPAVFERAREAGLLDVDEGA